MNSLEPDKPPSYSDILRKLLASADGPVSTEELAAQLLEKHPSYAKNPRRAALAKIHEENGRQLVYLDDSHVLPLSLAYRGARYRLRLNAENVDKSALPVYEWFRDYLPQDFEPQSLAFINSQGDPIPFQILVNPLNEILPSGYVVDYKETLVVMKEWFRSQKIYRKDHILVTIENWERGVIRLERERFSDHRPDLLAERNQTIANGFYQLLESAKYEDILIHEALPTIYARMQEKSSYPPDHWAMIIQNDPRMITEGWSIRYAESGFPLFERLFAETAGQSLIALGRKITQEEGKQIFRFHTCFTHRPGIWRNVEIQGKQTLADLDGILRDVFNHDMTDHLSGYWKLVERGVGKRKRYREVDVGTVNPFEPAEGSDTPIAALKLQVGDKIKYVYDFGDWIEHSLELESIGEAEKAVHYPREISRNKPKYEYCVDCEKKGKQTVATWICYTCSENTQQDALLCEKCVDGHDDHYVDEIVY